jgi:hypothetical protein
MPCRNRGVCSLSMKEREDGATEEEVANGWKTYKELMKT